MDVKKSKYLLEVRAFTTSITVNSFPGRKGRACKPTYMKRVADNWIQIIRIIGFTGATCSGPGRL